MKAEGIVAMKGTSELRERKLRTTIVNDNNVKQQQQQKEQDISKNDNDRNKYKIKKTSGAKTMFLSFLCTFLSGNVFLAAIPVTAVLYTFLDYFQIKFWIVPLAICYFLNLIISSAQLKPHDGSSLLRDSEYFRSHFDYFPMTVHTSANLNADSQYIFSVHPHGIHCWPLNLFSCLNSPFYERFPNIRPCIGLAASVIFMIPGAREVFIAMGYVDAGRSTAQRVLKSGRNLYICTGGEAESMLTENGKDRVVLEDRKGFIRLALSYGVDLVPVYGCGVNELYPTYTIGWTLRKWIQKNFNLALPIFYGRFFTGMPFQRPISVLIGEPISTPKPKTVGEKPDDTLVDEYHEKFMKALKDLFDEYKVKDEIIGYDENRVLEIVSSKKSLFDCLR